MCRLQNRLFNRLARASLFHRTIGLAVAVAVLLSGCTSKFNYPPAHRGDVVDDYFGTKVPDPYRWLEDPDSPETQTWVAAENKLTESFVDTPVRDKVWKRMTELLNYTRYSVPEPLDGRYAYTKNDGLQNQDVYFIQDGLEGEPRVVIDPNSLSEDGTVALSTAYYSPDGHLLAYGLSKSGSDQQQIHIRNVDSGEDYPEVLNWCRFAAVAWHPGEKGFYYDRFPEKGTVPDEDLVNYNKVYWHTIGTPQEDDRLVYADSTDKELGFSPSITDDGAYLLLEVWLGTSRKNGLLIRDINSTGPFRTIMAQGVARFRPVGNMGPTFYVWTDLDAPRGRIVAVDSRNPEIESWRTVVPERTEVIEACNLVHEHLVVNYMKDAHSELEILALDGTKKAEVELPTLGSVHNIQGSESDREFFFSFMSFTYPKQIYRYDMTSFQLSLYRDSDVDFDGSNYVTEQVFYTSKDGTRVPMFIVHSKDIELDGNNPTILYGYGGFTLSRTPYYSTRRIFWLEQGGVFALANLRGGNEYGEEWHRAGMLENKQNVFDDFIAAAEWLIANKYTNNRRLVIRGGSNGGLLVAACEVQRPDLFGACIPAVPVIDMLRYQKFTVGRYWTVEYGNAEHSREEFEYLYAYSPLHNIKKGTAYPPTLITTADTDDRVVPMHGKKFAAALQAADAGENPILIRVETKAGHGGGKPITKVIDENADVYAFIFKVLGMKVRDEQAST